MTEIRPREREIREEKDPWQKKSKERKKKKKIGKKREIDTFGSRFWVSLKGIYLWKRKKKFERNKKGGNVTGSEKEIECGGKVGEGKERWKRREKVEEERKWRTEGSEEKEEVRRRRRWEKRRKWRKRRL